jgi:mannose-6-phosphate isomerase
VVLGAGPKARIIRGIKPGVSKPQLAELSKTGAVAELLLSFQPNVGDCVYVPAGTVHAIGPDVVVFEVQQNSDVTYRLYDWGRQREVHVDKALAVAHLDTALGERPVVTPRALPQGELLVSTPHFRLRRLQVVEQRVALATEGAFAVINVIAGRGVLGWHSGGQDAPLFLQTGDCALVPACIDQVFLSPIGRLQVLISDPGEVR